MPRRDREILASLLQEKIRRQTQTIPTEPSARPALLPFRGNNLAVQTLTAREWLLSGPSETGKTLAGLSRLDRELRQYAGAQAALIRKVRADMEGSVLQLYREHFVHGGVTVFGGERAEWFDYPNGARLWVGGLDRASAVLSSARDMIYVNQAEELLLADWETFLTRVTGRAGHVPQAWLGGDCNPGGALHWILKRGEISLLPTTHKDNPSLYDEQNELTERGRTTLALLASLSGARKARLFSGLWYTAEGIVYDEFSEGNLTNDEPDPALPIEIGVDDGYIDPRAILFIQRTPERILVFDEIYHSRHLAETCVGEIIERCEKRGWPRPQLAIGSPEAKELQERLRRANIPFRPPPPDLKSIAVGIDIVRRLLCDANGIRELQIHRCCSNLIAEMTDGYRYPPGARRDSETPLDESNHACDALRYWCVRRARR